MGMSKEARFASLVGSVNRLYRLGKQLKKIPKQYDADDSTLINSLIGLWHDLLGCSSSPYWFCSPRTARIDPQEQSLWSLAIAKHLPYINGGYDGQPAEIDDGVLKEEESDNAFEHQLNIGSILEHEPLYGKRNRLIWDINQQSGEVVCDLRYHEDKFPQLNKSIDVIQGECYSIMQDDEQFAKAYLIHHICLLLYGGEHYDLQPDKQDFTTRWLADSYLHHNLPRAIRFEAWDGRSLTDIVNLHLKLINSKAEDLELNRLLVAIELTYHYHADHAKQLLDAYRQHRAGVKKSVLKAEIKLIKVALADSVKRKQEYQKSEKDRCQEELADRDLHAYRTDRPS